MRKIIDGKQYNTDTAKEVGSWGNGLGYRDLTWMSENLYRKKTGEFFLYGEGGPSSKYAESVGGNSWVGGNRIIPLSWEEARKWAEEHLAADEYEEIFGEVTDDESRIVISLSMAAGAVERAKRAAQQAGISLSAYIETLIG